LPNPILPAVTIGDSAAPPPGPSFTVSPEVESAVLGLDDTPLHYAALLEAGNDVIPEVEPSGQIRPYLPDFYDKGFVIIAPSDKQHTPFALKLNVTSQSMGWAY
jgi:hypothetical protein